MDHKKNYEKGYEWWQAKDRLGGDCCEFRSQSHGRPITGAVWLPSEPSETLVCLGHGASGDRYQLPITELAQRLSRDHGLTCLAMDGPVHGLRSTGEENLRSAFVASFLKPEALTDITNDWNNAVDLVTKQTGSMFNALAYFGLSMGTFLGLPWIASRTDIKVAVLGLAGVFEGFPHGEALIDAAAKLKVPSLFLMQLDDQDVQRDHYLALFDALASPNKRIHAHPGVHEILPAEEIDAACNFLLAHLEVSEAKKLFNIVTGEQLS